MQIDTNLDHGFTNFSLVYESRLLSYILLYTVHPRYKSAVVQVIPISVVSFGYFIVLRMTFLMVFLDALAKHICSCK